MRKLILKMQITVDGFVGGPNGELDWMFTTMSDDLARWIVEGIGRAGVHIMGSRTFHDMAAHWPTSSEPFAPPMNDIPKVVFSKDPNVKSRGATATTGALESARRAAGTARTPGRYESWRDARVATGDLTAEITKLKREPGGDIVAHGGASFARSLVRLGLIDEYDLVVHPGALGRGLGLFADLAAPLALTLVRSVRFSGGAVANVYEPKR